MLQRKRLIVIVICLLVFAAVALIGGILGRKSGKITKEEAREVALRCAYDGTRIRPLYQVDAFLTDGTCVSFCSIYCATQWFKDNKDKVIYVTVIDEVTGQKFDSTLGHFVESDVVTVPEVRNRIHVFAVKEDALAHARQFLGRLIDNPFGEAFVLPQVARFDRLKIGAPDLPDSIPLKLGVFRPIFKENRLNVEMIPFKGEREAKRIFEDDSVEGIICDLPTGLALTKGGPPARIVKNVLRANPFRALFAIVAGPKDPIRDLAQLEGRVLAVPRGLSFRFYMEFYLGRAGLSLDKIVLKEVASLEDAWELLNKGEVSAAVLRTPYTDMAMAKKLPFLADDRNLPWMSVLVLKEAVIDKKFEVIKRFIFGLEQSVLALNLKPDEFRALLEEQGGIPKERRKSFPMPIFEGANAPSPDEIEAILEWLDQKGIISKKTPYDRLVNANFLPNPNDVGLAFCCR